MTMLASDKMNTLSHSLVVKDQDRRRLGSDTLLARQMGLEHPQFFVLRSERLSTLLSVVASEASAATDPQACIDFLDLTDILIDLLDKAQLYSMLHLNDICKREKEVKSFIERFEAVGEAVDDWDSRTRTKSEGPSRKRARSGTLEAAVREGFKRPKLTELEHDVVADAVDDGQFEVLMPPIEPSPTPWWFQPFYG